MQTGCFKMCAGISSDPVNLEECKFFSNLSVPFIVTCISDIDGQLSERVGTCLFSFSDVNT